MQDIKKGYKKLDDLEYIKKFRKIKTARICRKLRIDVSNLMSYRSTKQNAKKVREEIESEIAKLYIKNEENKNVE